MSISPISNSMYTVSKNDKGSTIISYNDPNMKDEECTYTFNEDGSATCVSHAWGTKREIPKDTLIYQGNVAPEVMVGEFNAYDKYQRKLNVLA